jgi:hypothetical protein
MRIRWTRNVARMEEYRNGYGLLIVSRKEIEYKEFLDIEGRIVLRWIFDK